MRRRTALGHLAALSGAAYAPWLGAQTFNGRTLKIMVGYPVGGVADFITRTTTDGLGAALGANVVVENRPGAGGNIGAQAVARAAPDGYTQLFTGGGVLITNAYAFKTLPFDPVKDFAPVAMITESGGFAVSINPELPAKTLTELIAVAKARPGKLSYAVDSSNIYAGIIGKLLNRVAGLDVVEIPYKSTPQALQDTVAGRTQIIISAVAPVTAMPCSSSMARVSSRGSGPKSYMWLLARLATSNAQSVRIFAISGG